MIPKQTIQERLTKMGKGGGREGKEWPVRTGVQLIRNNFQCSLAS